MLIGYLDDLIYTIDWFIDSLTDWLVDYLKKDEFLIAEQCMSNRLKLK